MTPINQDPKRRIRRIRRWTRAAIVSGGMPPHASCLFHVFDQHWRSESSLDNAVERLNAANAMFAKESAWLCDYALRITTDHGRATSRLGEIEGALRRIGAAVHEISPHVSPCSTPDTLAYEVESACRIVEDSRDMKKRKP